MKRMYTEYPHIHSIYLCLDNDEPGNERCRQFVSKIPMVHEGSNVQAMEARGISTALGSLNRLIRALNDMKERAKNLLQWSLFRESQLMERMVFLHQPTLADYLRNYCDKRNAVAESYAYGTQKAKNTNLKQFAETIRFLEEQDVRTPEQLTEKIQEFAFWKSRM